MAGSSKNFLRSLGYVSENRLPAAKRIGRTARNSRADHGDVAGPRLVAAGAFLFVEIVVSMVRT